MTRLAWTLVGIGLGVGAIFVVRPLWQRYRRWRRVIDSGLDLAALVALLPPELQDRQYVGFAVSPVPPSDPHHELVGLVYRVASLHPGNPPNVGLEVDLENRTVIAVHPDGIGLGLK